jgi:hypothetical protein
MDRPLRLLSYSTGLPCTHWHGLRIWPGRLRIAAEEAYEHSTQETPTLDRLLILGLAPPDLTKRVTAWAMAARQPRPEALHAAAPTTFAYDVTLRDLARRDSQLMARQAATGLEYPIEHLPLDGPAWPLMMIALPVGVGLLILATVYGLLRWRQCSRQAHATAPWPVSAD